MLNIASLYSDVNPNTVILLSIAIMLFSGFLATRITKKLKLPNVTGYIIAGILIGPSMLHLVPETVIDNCAFLSDIALAFVAFNTGRFFRRQALEQTGKSVVLITLLESFLSGILIIVVCYFPLRLSWELSLLLGAIATATSPTSTLMTIQQYKAHGEFVDTLLQVIAVDNIVCLLIYSVISAIVGSESTLQVSTVVMPILYNLLSIGLGIVCGLLLCTIITPKRTSENRLILTVGLLCGLGGICAVMNISPLLSCMMFGAVYINRSGNDAIYQQIARFNPPIMSMFFVISGMNLNVSSLAAFGIVGFVYVIIRIIGKYAGTYVGCMVTKKRPQVRNYLGLALIPQASVAIGLAFLGQRLLPAEIGDLLLSIILAAAVVYELVGPACAKLALSRSGAIPQDAMNPDPVVQP